MSRSRLTAIVLASMVLLGACSKGDDPPVATLASVPPTTKAGSTPTSKAPSSIPTPPEDFGPPPPEVISTGELAGVPAAAGFTVRNTFRPDAVSGLCGLSEEYAKVWAVEAVNAETDRLFRQTVFDLGSPEAVEAFIASLQGAEQDCSWENGGFTFKYLSQETGVGQVGDAHFAYRSSFGPTGGGTVEEPVLQVWVKKGALLISVGAPGSTSLDVINEVLRLSVE